MFKNQKEYYKTLKELHKMLPLFFQPWWLDEVCKDWSIALFKENSKIKAIFPFQIEKKMGITIIRNPLLSPYMGPFFLEQDSGNMAQWSFSEKAIAALLDQFPQWDYFKMETTPEFKDFAALHKLGFANHAKLTYYIDLGQTEADLCNNIHSRRRNYIRKAAKELTVSRDLDPDLNLLYKWHKRVFEQKKQFYPYSVSFFERIISQAEHQEASMFLTAKNKEGNPVAMLWAPFDHRKAYHLLGAYNPQNNINGAMDLLIWNAVKNAKEAGKEIYDFEGSMDPGIELFFRKFGGNRQQYFSFSQNKSFIWKIKRALFP